MEFDKPFTREQALTAVSLWQFQWAVRSGRWRRLFRNVYVDADVELELAARAYAACLSVGPRAVVGLSTAAELHGFGVRLMPWVELVVPRGVDGLNQPGLRVTTAALHAAEVEQVCGVPCTSPARTAIDLVRARRRLDALPVLDAVLRGGLTDRDALLAEVDRHFGLRGVVQARELVPLADPRAESPMESRLRLIIRDGGLPDPTPQLWVADRYRLDLAWPDELVAAEYDGSGHLDRDQLRKDRERHNWLSARGWQLRYFTDVDVFHRPYAILAALRPLLAPYGDDHRVLSAS